MKVKRMGLYVVVMLLVAVMSLQACSKEQRVEIKRIKVDIGKLNLLEKKCEKIFFTALKDNRYKGIAIKFLSYSKSNKFFNLMSNAMSDFNLDITRKDDIVRYVGTLNNREEWLYRVYKNNKIDVLRHRALASLLNKKSKLINLKEAKNNFVRFMKSRKSYFKYSNIPVNKEYNLPINVLYIMERFGQLLLKEELVDNFIKTENPEMSNMIYKILEYYKYPTLNSLVINKLQKIDMKQRKMVYYLVRMLKPGFGEIKKAILYFKYVIRKGNGSYLFNICVQGLQRFFPEKSIIYRYFKKSENDQGKIMLVNSSFRTGLIKVENRRAYIRFLIEKVENPNKGYVIISSTKHTTLKYENVKILKRIYKYEADYPEITKVVLKILKSDNYYGIRSLLLNRRLKIDELKYIVPLLGKKLKFRKKKYNTMDANVFQLVIARSIMNCISEYKNSVKKDKTSQASK